MGLAKVTYRAMPLLVAAVTVTSYVVLTSGSAATGAPQAVAAAASSVPVSAPSLTNASAVTTTQVAQDLTAVAPNPVTSQSAPSTTILAPATTTLPVAAQLPTTTVPSTTVAPPETVPPTTAAPAVTTAQVVAASVQEYSYGCAAAVAYLDANAAPGFRIVCPGYAEGHEAMTCENAGPCPGEKVIVIADPCPAAYRNEASNSRVFAGLSDARIDPFGAC